MKLDEPDCTKIALTTIDAMNLVLSKFNTEDDEIHDCYLVVRAASVAFLLIACNGNKKAVCEYLKTATEQDIEGVNNGAFDPFAAAWKPLQ